MKKRPITLAYFYTTPATWNGKHTTLFKMRRERVGLRFTVVLRAGRKLFCGGCRLEFPYRPTDIDPSPQPGCAHIYALYTGTNGLKEGDNLTAAGKTMFEWRWAARALTT